MAHGVIFCVWILKISGEIADLQRQFSTNRGRRVPPMLVSTRIWCTGPHVSSVKYALMLNVYIVLGWSRSMNRIRSLLGTVSVAALGYTTFVSTPECGFLYSFTPSYSICTQPQLPSVIRAVDIWNSLPAAVVFSHSVSTFKSRLRECYFCRFSALYRDAFIVVSVHCSLIIAALCNRGPLYFCPVVSFLLSSSSSFFFFLA